MNGSGVRTKAAQVTSKRQQAPGHSMTCCTCTQHASPLTVQLQVHSSLHTCQKPCHACTPCLHTHDSQAWRIMGCGCASRQTNCICMLFVLPLQARM